MSDIAQTAQRLRAALDRIADGVARIEAAPAAAQSEAPDTGPQRASEDIDEIARLTAELDAAQAERDRLSAALEDANHEIDALKAARAAEQAEWDGIVAELTRLGALPADDVPAASAEGEDRT